jgi:hypothetical protein
VGIVLLQCGDGVEAETVEGPVSQTESYNDPFGASMGHDDTIDADVARGC